MARTAFKLRSPSPFKQDQAVAQEGGENVLKNVNVNKGKKSIYTYKKMHADLLKKGMSQGDADAEVNKARGFNDKKYGTQNPTLEGKANNTVTEADTMDTSDIATDPTEGKTGSIMDSFSPGETRSMIRERKIQKNRKDKYENKNRRQTGRYDKAFKNSGMSKEDFDQTKRGKRLNMKMDQSGQDIADYTTGYARSQMANQQGVNERDGTKVEYDPDNVSMQAATSSTPGSDKTVLSDEEAKGYKNVEDIQANLGTASSTTTDAGYSDALSGGDSGGAAETTTTGNDELENQASEVSNTSGVFGGDTIMGDENKDGNMLSRFVAGIGNSMSSNKGPEMTDAQRQALVEKNMVAGDEKKKMK